MKMTVPHRINLLKHGSYIFKVKKTLDRKANGYISSVFLKIQAELIVESISDFLYNVYDFQVHFAWRIRISATHARFTIMFSFTQK